jgi:hypothetical protein
VADPKPVTVQAAGHLDEDVEFVELLVEHQDLDGLQARADAGDSYAANHLAGLLAGRSVLDEMHALGGRSPRWWGSNSNTSAGSTAVGSLPTTAKNVFKSNATARSVLGRTRPATNSR